MLVVIWLRGLLGRRGGRLAAAAVGITFAVALLAALGSFLGASKATMAQRSIQQVWRKSPARPYLSVIWTDPETGAHGYLVIDTVVRGVAGGGLRMRPGCTLAEVADLARAMTYKEAIAFRRGAHYLPLGGAKGGIDFDPTDHRAREVLGRYLEAMLPLLEVRWAVGEDLGVRQDELDELAAALGMSSTVDAALRYVHDGPDAGLARLRAAFACADRGVGLGELVGGYGVAPRRVARDDQDGVVAGDGAEDRGQGRVVDDGG